MNSSGFGVELEYWPPSDLQLKLQQVLPMTSRRSFLQSAGLAAAALCSRALHGDETPGPLQAFSYGDVELAPGLAQTQFEQTQSVLISLNEDSLLKPWRLRAGLPAPGPELGDGTTNCRWTKPKVAVTASHQGTVSVNGFRHSRADMP